MVRPWVLIVGALIVAVPSLGADTKNSPTRGAPSANGADVAYWVGQLSHPSSGTRASAAKRLAESGSEDAIEPLVARLADADADVRLQVATALGKINRRPEASAAALTRLLRDGDEHVRYAAQWSLGQVAAGALQPGQRRGLNRQRIGELLAAAVEIMRQTGAQEGLRQRVQAAANELAANGRGRAVVAGSPPSLAALIEQLREPDVYTQVRALTEVKRIEPVDARALIEALAKESQESILGWKLPVALAELGPAIAPHAARLVESDDEAVVDLAIDVLEELGADAKDALPQLIKVLGDRDATEERLEKTLVTIGRIGPAAKEAAPPLARLAASAKQSDFVRIEALGALGAIGPNAHEALPRLTKLLQGTDDSTELRIETAGAIAKIADKKNTMELLIPLIEKSEDLELAVGVAAKLGLIGAEAAMAVPQLLRLIESPDVDSLQRQEMVQALGEIGASDAGTISLLVRLLVDSADDSQLQVAAARALGKLGPAAVAALGDELGNNNRESHLTVARALVEMGSRAAPALERLIGTLESDEEDDGVRELAAIAIGNVGPSAKGAVAALTKQLRNEENDERLRAMCAAALGSIDPAATSVLQAACVDSSKDVQVAAAYAIAKNRREGSAAALTQLMRLLVDAEAEEMAAQALADIGKAALPLLAAAANDLKNELDSRVTCVGVLAEIGLDSANVLLKLLNDADMAEAAEDGLKRLGDGVLPAILAAAEDEKQHTPEARETMRELVRYFHDGLGAGGDDLEWGPAHPLARMDESVSGAGAGSGASGKKIYRIETPLMVMGKKPEVVPASGFKSVKVFYGTNRKPIAGGAAAARLLTLHNAALVNAALVALAICLFCLLWQTPKNKLALSAGVIGMAVLAAPQLYERWLPNPESHEGASLTYGGELSEQVEMGVCEVTIPEIHEEGELESPSLLNLEIKVDPEKHIVLKSVQKLASETFFADLGGELGRKGKNVLVFIHGYNVTFEDAARRTAQMAADLKFPGAALFYSWPSQGHWYKYRLDEKNVELSVEPLKAFLLQVAERSGATTINVVAHSMGNRALTGALKEIDTAARENKVLLNEVVLAAPDIDASIFKQRIAPAIVMKARRITLYASSKDLALYASRQFNSGDPRAGDAGQGLVVVPGIETIDASDADCSLIGHCYYGDNVSVLRDIEHLLRDEPAQKRPFLHPMTQNGMTYWMFEPEEVAQRVIRSEIR